MEFIKDVKNDSEAKYFPILKKYLYEKNLDVKTVDNYNRRGFVSNINKTVWFIAYNCQENKITTKKDVGAFLQRVMFLSDVAVRRYIKMIIVLEIFDWSEYTKTFKLPKHIADEIDSYTPEQKEALLNSTQEPSVIPVIETPKIVEPDVFIQQPPNPVPDIKPQEPDPPQVVEHQEDTETQEPETQTDVPDIQQPPEEDGRII